MSNDPVLKIRSSIYIARDGSELKNEDLTEEQYQKFCNDFEQSRIRYKIKWPSLDERYTREKTK